MNNFKHFTLYVPDEDKHNLAGAGILFLRDDDGHDWYDCQSTFQTDTVKIAYNDDGVVVSIADDVSALWPAGLSVAEVASLPDGCDISGRWKFDGKQVVDSLTVADALARKTAEINAWRDTQEQGNVIFTVNGNKWDASLASLTRIEPVITLIRGGATLPDSFFWTNAENKDIPATTDLLTAIYAGMQQALVAQGFKIHERQRQMKGEVAKLATPAAILAYAVGWPEKSQG